VACQDYQAEPGAEAATEAHARPRETVFLEAAAHDDWLGVQAYTRTVVGLEGGKAVERRGAQVERTLNGWEYYPAALGNAVRTSTRVVGPQVPIIVTENGIATADDQRRIDYTSEALEGLLAAMRDGIDVRGYFHWSLLDNYEWGSYIPTFGLVAVDRTTFERTPKPSLAWLGSIGPTALDSTSPPSTGAPLT
jgi:beta-glucosidase